MTKQMQILIKSYQWLCFKVTTFIRILKIKILLMFRIFQRPIVQLIISYSN